MDLSFVTLMEVSCALTQLSGWRILLDLAGDGADLRLADFISSEVRGMVEDRNAPEVSSAIQFRYPGGKHTPYLRQQKPVDYRPHLYR